MISLEGITKKFGSFTAVDRLSFEVRKNEIFGLLGPNGAGKTTTISMICGLMAPTIGKIRISDAAGRNLKRMIGFCSQENIFYPKLTCLEQLVFIGEMYGLTPTMANKNAMQLLSKLGLHEKARKPAGSLSGGMKRRLNIALALIHSPEVLILDEPEAGLDPQSRVLVRDFIREFGITKTVILTTHNMDEADRLANRIAIMDHGKLLMLDTPDNLKKSTGEGELLEIAFESQTALQNFISFPAEISYIKKSENTLFYKGKYIAGRIPVIIHQAEKAGAVITEIRLRENTLEDVFIHLTGRNLRE